MSEEKMEKDDGECRVTVKVEGREACCGAEAGDLKLDGKQRVIKVVCCPSEEKKAQWPRVEGRSLPACPPSVGEPGIGHLADRDAKHSVALSTGPSSVSWRFGDSPCSRVAGTPLDLAP